MSCRARPFVTLYPHCSSLALLCHRTRRVQGIVPYFLIVLFVLLFFLSISHLLATFLYGSKSTLLLVNLFHRNWLLALQFLTFLTIQVPQLLQFCTYSVQRFPPANLSSVTSSLTTYDIPGHIPTTMTIKLLSLNAKGLNHLAKGHYGN